MASLMQRFRNDDTGAVAIVFAIVFLVLVGIAALTVDVGYWYASKRQLQAAADAAALAGCQDLAHEASNADISATVEDFAGRNFTAPLDSAESEVISTEIDTNAVKVTVGTDARVFLSQWLLGRGQTLIRAQAVARIGYLSGASTPVPWGLPLLHATRVSASAGGGTETWLSDPDEDARWEGVISTGSTGPVVIRAYNDQTLDPAYPDGVPEVAEGAGYVVRIPNAAPFTSISTARLDSGGDEHEGSVVYTSLAGESVVVYATVATELPPDQSLAITLGNQDIPMTKVTATLWRGQFAAPTTEDLQADYTYGLKQKRGGQTLYELPTPAGGFLVRRSTFPIGDVILQPSATTSTTTDPVRVTVELNDYQYGKIYDMKVTGGGGEVGNFMALDFHTLRHPPYWRHPQDPFEYPAMPSGTQANYYPYIAGTASFPFVMHLNDAVWTQSGNLSGPTTRDALETRFAGEDADFAAWEQTKGPSRRLVLVPIVEKIQETTGSTPLRVISFGTFYVLDVVAQGGDVSVKGVFVEYTAPGMDVVDDPPGPIVVEAVHLTARDLDF